MAEHGGAIRAILRPVEEVKLILETTIMLPDTVDHIPDLPTENDPGRNHDSAKSSGENGKRAIALITHKHGKNGYEDACLFVFKPITDSVSRVLEIQCVFPITDKFSVTISIAETQQNDIYASLERPRTGLNLLISSRSENSPEPLTVLTYDVQQVRLLLGECKRFKELYSTNHADHIIPIKAHSWVEPYLYKLHRSPLLSSVPLDLRISKQPLHALLSPSSAGFPGDEVENIRLIRDDWVRNTAWNACVSTSSTAQSKHVLSIHIGTFNVNGKPPSQDLSPWLAYRNESRGLPPGKQPNGGQEGGEQKTPSDTLPSKPRSPLRNFLSFVVPKSDALSQSEASPVIDESRLREPDVLVFAFQELDLSTETLLYSSSTAKAEAWHTALCAALGKKADLYSKLASKQMVGVLLVIIVKKRLRSCFHDIQTTSAGVGILGVMGNKGAVALRMKFSPHATPGVPKPHPTTLTFVNSHLAAFDEMKDKRNADFHELSARLEFKSGDHPDDPTLSVFETDALFWMGDLNYRINLPDSDVRDILASEQEGKLEILLKYDQLKHAISTHQAFGVFSEHPITHLPTYRFSTGALADGLGYDMKRKPAWTDRILHAGGQTAIVKQHWYTGHPEITQSDHRPLSAQFTVALTSIDTNQRGIATRNAYQPVSDMEYSEEHPQLQIDPKSIELGKVSYKHTVSRSVNLHNNGKVPCAYYFVPVESDTPIHPPWLTIEPMAGLLLPEESLSVSISAYVDKESASELNSALMRELSCILILHTARGQDYFIPVSGEYELTSFANNLEYLTRLPGPIRTVASIEELFPPERAVNAPREIVRLVQWLMTNATDVEGLFTLPAEDDLVETIRECLDTGEDFPFQAPHEGRIALAFGNAFLQFLDSLTDPVVPPSLHAQCVEVTDRDAAFEVLDLFPGVSVNVWISITAFLHYIGLRGASDSNLTEALASIFSQVLLPDDPSQSYLPVSPLRKRDFLLYFIT